MVVWAVAAHLFEAATHNSRDSFLLPTTFRSAGNQTQVASSGRNRKGFLTGEGRVG